MQERLQPEEQSLLTFEARVREATGLRLPLLLLPLEEVVQRTCPHVQKAHWPRGQSDTPSSLMSPTEDSTVIMRI